MRSDHVDGFTIDRGFQVLNTAYPELQRIGLPAGLDIGTFLRGALLRDTAGLHLVADPRQVPRGAAGFVAAPLGTRGAASRPRRLPRRGRAASRLPHPRREGRRAAGGARPARRAGDPVDHFLRPFLQGVLLERELTTSSRFAAFVLRTFARGDVGVPAAGMGALPAALAARLPRGHDRVRRAGGGGAARRGRRRRRHDSASGGGRGRRRPAHGGAPAGAAGAGHARRDHGLARARRAADAAPGARARHRGRAGREQRRDDERGAGLLPRPPRTRRVLGARHGADARRAAAFDPRADLGRRDRRVGGGRRQPGARTRCPRCPAEAPSADRCGSRRGCTWRATTGTRRRSRVPWSQADERRTPTSRAAEGLACHRF